jgi:hypothetical protein
MKKNFLIVSMILMISGCSTYNYKEHNEYELEKPVYFCHKMNSDNQCKYPKSDYSLLTSINKKDNTWQLFSYEQRWSGYKRVPYGKIAPSQADQAIAEVINFIKWSQLPDNEKIAKKAEYEKNIKLNVIGTQYHLEKGYSYARLDYTSDLLGISCLGTSHYLINPPTAKSVLLHLMLWKKINIEPKTK